MVSQTRHMIVQYDPALLKKLAKVDVRIRKSFKETIDLFKRTTHDLQLNNHALKREWKGYRSIDITADWRAIPIYFVALGTHDQLYK